MIINGEDLTPYRSASSAVRNVLGRFGVAEPLGMDEVFVDVTGEVDAREARGERPTSFCGHMHDPQVQGTGIAGFGAFETRGRAHWLREEGCGLPPGYQSTHENWKNDKLVIHMR